MDLPLIGCVASGKSLTLPGLSFLLSKMTGMNGLFSKGLSSSGVGHTHTRAHAQVSGAKFNTDERH